MGEAQRVWKGEIDKLPSFDVNGLSRKILLQNVPYATDEDFMFVRILQVLNKYTPIKCAWSAGFQGRAYIVFPDSAVVSQLLSSCERTVVGGVTQLSFELDDCTKIQVEPWALENNESHYGDVTADFDARRSVMVDNVPRDMTAACLKQVMAYAFVEVEAVRLFQDRYGYPTGRASVMFKWRFSRTDALQTKLIKIKTSHLEQNIVIVPFDQQCIPTREPLYFPWAEEVAGQLKFSRHLFVEDIPDYFTSGDLLNLFCGYDLTNLECSNTQAQRDGQSHVVCQAHVVLSESGVCAFLEGCNMQIVNGKPIFTFTVDAHNNRIRIFTWNRHDNFYAAGEKTQALVAASEKMVHVSNLTCTRPMTARTLAKAVAEEFGFVQSVALFTDEHQFPQGFARVTFRHAQSCRDAVRASTFHYRYETDDLVLPMQIKIKPWENEHSRSCRPDPASVPAWLGSAQKSPTPFPPSPGNDGG